MLNEARTSLRKALRRNYWSVAEGMQYLTYLEDNHSYLKDTGSTREAFSWHPEELLMLWLDTDHSEAPRDSPDNSDPYSAEYPVSYFFQWAASKNILVTWLEWAIEECLLPSDIAEKTPVDAILDQDHVPVELSPKKERTYLILIAALLHKQGIDWSLRTANSSMRKLVEEIGERIGYDATSSVLADLKNDEQINVILQELRNKVDPPGNTE